MNTKGVWISQLGMGGRAFVARPSVLLLSPLCPPVGVDVCFEILSNDLGSLGENQQGAQAPFVPDVRIRLDESSGPNLYPPWTG